MTRPSGGVVSISLPACSTPGTCGGVARRVSTANVGKEREEGKTGGDAAVLAAHVASGVDSVTAGLTDVTAGLRRRGASAARRRA